MIRKSLVRNHKKTRNVNPAVETAEDYDEHVKESRLKRYKVVQKVNECAGAASQKACGCKMNRRETQTMLNVVEEIL